MPRPARLIWKFSIDMAERNGALLRRSLRSAERLSERATARGLRLVNTPRSRSSASLVRMTRADQRLPRFARVAIWKAREQSACLNGSARALLGPEGRADGGDQLLGVDRLVDAIEEAGGHQTLALYLRKGGKRDRRSVVVGAARAFDGAHAPQRGEAVLARHGEIDEQHMRSLAAFGRFKRRAERRPSVEARHVGAGLAERQLQHFMRVGVIVGH